MNQFKEKDDKDTLERECIELHREFEKWWVKMREGIHSSQRTGIERSDANERVEFFQFMNSFYENEHPSTTVEDTVPMGYAVLIQRELEFCLRWIETSKREELLKAIKNRA